jgi:hypothetical protein
MAHEYRIETGDATDAQTLNDALATTAFDRVLTDRNQTFSERGPIDSTLEGCQATVYAADTEDRVSVETELEDVVASATAATIERRHVWSEYDDSRISDPTYYPSHISDGLRTDPDIAVDGFDLSVAVDSIHGGTEASASATLAIEPATADYIRRDRIVVDSDGLSIIQGTAVGEPAETGQQPVAPDTPSGALSVGTVTVKEHIDRVPNGGVDAASLVGDASDRTTVFEK